MWHTDRNGHAWNLSAAREVNTWWGDVGQLVAQFRYYEPEERVHMEGDEAARVLKALQLPLPPKNRD